MIYCAGLALGIPRRFCGGVNSGRGFIALDDEGVASRARWRSGDDLYLPADEIGDRPFLASAIVAVMIIHLPPEPLRLGQSVSVEYGDELIA